MYRPLVIIGALTLAACSSNPTTSDADIRVESNLSASKTSNGVAPIQNRLPARSGSSASTRTSSSSSSSSRSGTASASVTSSGSAVGSRLTSQEMNAILNEHNRVRANVNVAPLRWSAQLAQVAQKWTDHLASTSCGLTHSQGSGYGENLFMGTSSHYGVRDAVRSWEEEKKDYRGGVLTQSNWYPSGHYTQVVWRNTKSVGCAQAMCRGNTIVSCNYDPPGNYMGQAPY